MGEGGKEGRGLEGGSTDWSLSPYPMSNKGGKRTRWFSRGMAAQISWTGWVCQLLALARTGFLAPFRILLWYAELHFNISSAELTRASKLVLSQIEWSEVVPQTVGREKPAAYRDEFRTFLQAQSRSCQTQGRARESPAHEVVNRRKNELTNDTDTGGETVSVKDAADNGMQHLDDDILTDSEWVISAS